MVASAADRISLCRKQGRQQPSNPKLENRHRTRYAIRAQAYKDSECAESNLIPSTAASSAGSQAARRSSISTDNGASTATAARNGGSKGARRVPRTGRRFVHHLNRLSALAFLRPVRKVSLGAEFPTRFREPILRPGLPTTLPRAGRPKNSQATQQRSGFRFAAVGKSDIFASGPNRE